MKCNIDSGNDVAIGGFYLLNLPLRASLRRLQSPSHLTNNTHTAIRARLIFLAFRDVSLIHNILIGIPTVAAKATNILLVK